MSEIPFPFVLLDNPVAPDLSAVVETLRARHPELPVHLLKDGGLAAPSLIHCGDEMVVIAVVPRPIPEDAALWSRAARIWPEAKTVGARHRGHLYVTAVGGSKSLLQSVRITTAVVGALIAATPECCAVVWAAKVAHSAKLWLEQSARSFAPYPDYPLTLWFDILPFNADPGFGAVTIGLSNFVGREIEFETTKLDFPTMLGKVLSLAAYLIEHGNVVKDGHTIGADELEHFTVRHTTSDRFEDLPVLFCADPVVSS